MAKNEPMGRLHFKVAPSGVGTPAYEKIPTGVSPAGGYALKIQRVLLFATLSKTDSGLGAAKAELTAQITRSENSGALLPGDDTEVMAQISIQSVHKADDVPFKETFPVEMDMANGLLIVTPSIFLGYYQEGFDIAPTLTGIIEYTTEKMSEVEILRILQG